MTTLFPTRRPRGRRFYCPVAASRTPANLNTPADSVKGGAPSPRPPSCRSVRDRLRVLTRAFKERVVPVWVLVDMLAGPWVVVDFFIRSKGFFATQLRHFAEYLMLLAGWR